MVKDVASCDFDLVVKELRFTIAFDQNVKPYLTKQIVRA